MTTPETNKEQDENTEVKVLRPYTDEQVEEHAAKSGGRRNLREIAIDTDDGYQFVYLVKKPSKNLMQAIAAEESKKDKANVTTLQNLMLGCVLEGDKDVYENDGAVYMQLVKNIGSLVKTAHGDLKKI